MATCRECLHIDICSYKNYQDAVATGKDKEVFITIRNNLACRFFTPKSEYVKRERGEWVKQQFVQPLFDFNGVEYAQVSARCTNCGRDTYDVVDSENKEKYDYINYKICPHCSADMRKEDNNDNWISVKDRLPEFSGDVLVCYRTGESFCNFMRNEVCYYADGKFTRSDGCITYTTVTHWQPLPEPPKGE